MSSVVLKKAFFRNIGFTVVCFFTLLLFACSEQDTETKSESATGIGQPDIAQGVSGQNKVGSAISDESSAEDSLVTKRSQASVPPMTAETRSMNQGADLGEASGINQKLLTAMQQISQQQAAATERDSVAELEELSEADRQALQNIAAQETMIDAQQKAAEQAVKIEESRAEQQQQTDSQN